MISPELNSTLLTDSNTADDDDVTQTTQIAAQNVLSTTNNISSPTQSTTISPLGPSLQHQLAFENDVLSATDNFEQLNLNNVNDDDDNDDELLEKNEYKRKSNKLLNKSFDSVSSTISTTLFDASNNNYYRRRSLDRRGSVASRSERQTKQSRIIIRKFQKLDQSQLSSTPAPDVKIGQRIAYKEYYGNEFGTIRWIGRVPQICPDWTVGVEFDNAIGEGDGSLNGRRYFIAKDCFAKFLPLNNVDLVDQHVGRPEPGTMISVMSAAVRPGQMISIQRVSTVHVQHCFLNAPHQIPGADILAVNTRLHCQCPNCGPCAHVIKPPRTQRLARAGKNATHMCQFSTYTCCGMESQEETMCTYTGNKVSAIAPPPYHGGSSTYGLPPLGNSWIDGAGYLTNLQAQQSKSMPEEYKTLGNIKPDSMLRRLSRSSSSRRNSGRFRRKHTGHKHHHTDRHHNDRSIFSPSPTTTTTTSDNTINGAQNNNNNERLAQNQDYTDYYSRQQQQQQLVQLDKGDYLNTNNNNITTNFSQNNMQYHTSSSYTHQQQSQTYNHQLALVSSNSTNKQNINYDERTNFSNDNNNNTWYEQSSKQEKSKNAPKCPKVVYRNSIENRYLFPTDDAIDSTLEADLENLSQARYGQSTYQRLSGSRNIFKSLRSLVSCLSARSNHSELERQFSENTMRFSEQVTKGTGNNNKCMPDLIMPTAFDKQSQEDLCAQLKFSLSEKEKNALHFKYDDNINNNNNNNHDSSILDPPASVLDNFEKNKSEMTPSKTSTTTGQDQQQQPVKRHISSSSDCGFSSASQASINYQPFAPCSPGQLTIEDELKTKQIYRRIVARLLNTTSVASEDLFKLRRILFEPTYMDTTNNCCLHNHPSLATNLTNQAFNQAEFDQIIADIIQKSFITHQNTDLQLVDPAQQQQQQTPTTITSCCLHDTNNNNCFSNGKQLDLEQQLRKLDKSGADFGMLMNNTNSNYMQIGQLKSNVKSANDCCSSTSGSVTLSSYCDSFCGTAIVGAGATSNSNSRSNSVANEQSKKRPTSDHQVVSEESKSMAAAATTQQDANNLPKAFELKLTLSINSDKNVQILPAAATTTNKEACESDVVEIVRCKSENQNDHENSNSSNLLNSTSFNINIKSSSSGTKTTNQQLSEDTSSVLVDQDETRKQ